MSGARSEESCEAEGRVVAVPVVVEPVPVHHHLAAVLVEIRDVEVAVAVHDQCTECLPYHHPSNTLRIVCGGPAVFGIIMPEHSVPSIFNF